MGEALTERNLHYPKKRQPHNKLLALVGLSLLVLALGGWVVSLLFFSPRTSSVPRTVPSSILKQGLSGGGCDGERFCADPSSIYFITPQGQSNQYLKTVSLFTSSKTVGSWSGMTGTNQGSDWLSISPTKGNFNSAGTQQIAIAVSSNTLAIGMYHGTIKFIEQSGLITAVDVYVEVIPASLKDFVAYTPVSDLTIVASWPHLVKGHAANITISLLAQNLSQNLLRAPTLAELERIPLPGNAAPFGIGGGGEHEPLKIALPTYELMTVSAHLEATSFDVSQSDPPPQTPYQRMVSFDWNIFPKGTGLQGIAVDFAGLWKSKYPGEPLPWYFLRGKFAVNVDDNDPLPFITLGHLDLGSLLLGLLGSVLNIPWLLEYIKKKQHTSPGQTKQRKGKSHKTTHGH